MRQLLMTGVLVLAAMGLVSKANAQVQDESRLKAEVENLRKQVRNLEKENELLKREIELMKKEGKGSAVAVDDSTDEEKPRKTAIELGSVEYELVKCVRDPKIRDRVTFSFAVKCDNGAVQTVHGCKQLTLSTSNGEVVDGKIASVSKDMVMLTKGKTSKFQVTYQGVDPKITSFDEVALTMGSQLGFPRLPISFFEIKIEPK